MEVPMGAFARPPLRKKSFVLVPWLCFSNFLCGVSNNPRVVGNFLSFAFISGYENFYDIELRKVPSFAVIKDCYWEYVLLWHPCKTLC